MARLLSHLHNYSLRYQPHLQKRKQVHTQRCEGVVCSPVLLYNALIFTGNVTIETGIFYHK